MIPRSRRLLRACAACSAFAAGMMPATCQAKMTSAASAGATFASAVLQAATGLNASTCTKRTLTLTWTGSASSFTTGYQVWDQQSGGTPLLEGTVPGSATSVLVTVPRSNVNYSFWLVATYRNWTSLPSTLVTASC